MSLIKKCTFLLVVFAVGADATLPSKPVNTYSIVARDAQTGELGVAVQSHWFSVGSIVLWAEPGIGAVATQSFVEASYGPLGLELMRAGKSASQTLTALLAADEHANVRQVGMVDANGGVANHTGKDAIDEHCHKAGDGFTVQANLMWKPTVCDAMFIAYQRASGDLGDRLMAALKAAENEGGDVRGKQSSALLVVSADRTQPAWGGRIYDLRVEDHPQPLEELQRLLTISKAYNRMNKGDELLAEGDVQGALNNYRQSQAMVPDNHEMIFWHAVTLVSANQLDEALPLFKKAFDQWPLWREVIPRLVKSGLMEDQPEVLEKILKVK